MALAFAASGSQQGFEPAIFLNNFLDAFCGRLFFEKFVEGFRVFPRSVVNVFLPVALKTKTITCRSASLRESTPGRFFL